MLRDAGRILYVVFWSAIAALILLMTVVFGLTALLDYGVFPESISPLIDRLQQWLNPFLKGFCLIWFFLVGGSIASFLNVVAWRIPRKLSILGPSRCPHCDIELKFPSENFPVFGWLKNGGQCGNCDAPIAIRYMLTEFVLGSAFLILALVQPDRIEILLIARDVELTVGYAYQLLLLSLLFAIVLFAMESFSANVVWFATGFAGMICFQLLPVSPGIADYRFGDWNEGTAIVGTIRLLAEPADFAVAVALGIIAGASCALLVRFTRRHNLRGVFASLLLIGTFLGWQAVLSVTILWLLLSPVSKTFNPCGVMFFATFLHLCSLSLQNQCQWWPGPASGPQQFLYAVIYIWLLSMVHRFALTQTVPNDTSGGPSESVSEISLPDTVADLE